jgi:hypothetical protein
MSLTNNHTYKAAKSISTITRIDQRASSAKTYACEAGEPYCSNDQVEVVRCQRLAAELTIF